MREENYSSEIQMRDGNTISAKGIEEQIQGSNANIVSEAESQMRSEEQASASFEEIAAPEQVSHNTSETRVLPYHERYYLKYREGKRSTALDLAGTRLFLQGLGYDGGELRQAREGKNRAESFQRVDKNRNNQMFCSYCGTEISGVEFSRLTDGRMRCNTCSSTVVKTKAEAEELCQRVIENMESFFGAVLEVPVSIEIMGERKIKRKLGVPLDKKDRQSMLILGVAMEKNKKYSIMLENGAPRISTISTFAHELTHIWQYTHWNKNKALKKCPQNKRFLLHEGMAKWAEIQYLYLIGETSVAKREEYITRNRQDAYGVGFRLYEEYYPLSRDVMSCEDTPFTPDRYPFD